MIMGYLVLVYYICPPSQDTVDSGRHQSGKCRDIINLGELTCVCVCLMGRLCWSGDVGRGLSAVSLGSLKETWLTDQEAEDHR